MHTSSSLLQLLKQLTQVSSYGAIYPPHPPVVRAFLIQHPNFSDKSSSIHGSRHRYRCRAPKSRKAAECVLYRTPPLSERNVSNVGLLAGSGLLTCGIRILTSPDIKVSPNHAMGDQTVLYGICKIVQDGSHYEMAGVTSSRETAIPAPSAPEIIGTILATYAVRPRPQIL